MFHLKFQTDYSAKKYEAAFKIFLRIFKDSSDRLGTKDTEAETLYHESLDYLAHIKSKNIEFTIDEETDAAITKKLAEIYKMENQSEKRDGRLTVPARPARKKSGAENTRQEGNIPSPRSTQAAFQICFSNPMSAVFFSDMVQYLRFSSTNSALSIAQMC